MLVYFYLYSAGFHLVSSTLILTSMNLLIFYFYLLNIPPVFLSEKKFLNLVFQDFIKILLNLGKLAS